MSIFIVLFLRIWYFDAAEWLTGHWRRLKRPR